MEYIKLQEAASGLYQTDCSFDEWVRATKELQKKSIEVEPAKYAEWKETQGGYPYECSRCGGKALADCETGDITLTKYCPYCGAEMTRG